MKNNVFVEVSEVYGEESKYWDDEFFYRDIIVENGHYKTFVTISENVFDFIDLIVEAIEYYAEITDDVKSFKHWMEITKCFEKEDRYPIDVIRENNKIYIC